jgi:hypothetical protein
MIVRVVSTHNRSALIEYLDPEEGIKRGIIPEELIFNNEVTDELLFVAIPYGVDWASALEGVLHEITPRTFADALYGYGFWTLQDLRQNPNAVIGVLLSVCGVDFQTLVIAAERQELHGGM